MLYASGFTVILSSLYCSGVERGFKDKAYPRLVKMLFSATLTRNPSKLGLLHLHHPLFMTTGQSRYAFPEKLEFFKVVWLLDYTCDLIAVPVLYSLN